MSPPRSATGERPGSALSGAVLGSIAIAAAVLAAYGRVAGHDFIAYDTQAYVTENPWVLRGLTWEGARRAFTEFQAANWHPLTWISHMADVELFGLRPGWHHAVNVAFHAANACLVFLLLRRLTGRTVPSFFAGALFALHPLHVESVAWIVERKDVLSAFFGLACAAAWVGWACEGSRRAYVAALAAFAAALLSKPMLVTWPFVLLLLDFWPLRRAGLGARRLVLEKAPFFALAAGCAWITYAAQQSFGAVASLERVSFLSRVANAVAAYAGYVQKTLWPAGLSFHVPHHGDSLTPSRVALPFLALAAVSAVAVGLRRRAPWLLFGWLFFLGMLVPVIGLVQVGTQAMADRYVYLPILGLFVAIVWSVAEALPVRTSARPAPAAVAAVAAAVAACTALGVATVRQTGHWRDLDALTRHALEIDERNHVALDLSGVARLERGELDEAERRFRAALAIAQGDVDALVNLANVLNKTGRHAEAQAAARRARDLAPSRPDARRQLAAALWGLGRREGASAELDAVLRANPDDPEALLIRGQVLAELGRAEESLAALEHAVAVSPTDPRLRLVLARHLALQGDRERSAREHEAARAELERTLERSDRDAAAHGMLGLVLLERGDVAAAETHLRRAIALDPSNVEALANLASLLQRAGRREEALEALEAAVRLAPARADLRRHLATLQAGTFR